MPTLDDLKRRFLDAQLAGDRRRAVALVTEARAREGVPGGDLRTHVIRASQEEIGRLWQRNEISIAQEHMATAISQLALAELFRHEDLPQPNGRKVVVACVDGELHDFPARLVADELDVAGFDVRFLGASVPADALASLVVRERPDLLVLSATMTFHADAVRAAVRRVRAVAPAVPIAVGGQVCSWVDSLGRELEVEIAGGDAAELIRAARQLLRVD
jgi:MerR family transcriptional regulator, light-induced transcriptional regulator